MKKKVMAITLAAMMAGTMSMGVYADEAEGTAYTVTYNMNDGNAEDMPEYQFVSGNMKGILTNDSRLYVQIDLVLDEAESAYTLTSNCYVVENGAVAVPGDDTGIGLTMLTTAEGTYEDNGDGTVTIATPEHVTHELEMDTYSRQMKEACEISVAGSSEYGVYDSDEQEEVLKLVPETIFTLGDNGSIETYEYLHPEDYETEEDAKGEGDDTEAAAGNALLEIASDDGATKITLYDDGSYEFYFESYDITDAGTYAYDGGVLALTDANGTVTESAADGDNQMFTYAYSQSDQLTGSFTVSTADLDGALG